MVFWIDDSVTEGKGIAIESMIGSIYCQHRLV